MLASAQEQWQWFSTQELHPKRMDYMRERREIRTKQTLWKSIHLNDNVSTYNLVSALHKHKEDRHTFNEEEIFLNQVLIYL